MMQIKVQGFAMAIRGVLRSGQKEVRFKWGCAVAQAAPKLRLQVWCLVIQLKSGGEDRIFF